MSAGICLYPWTRRNCFSATSSPDPTQRSRWSLPCQRFTFRQTCSTIENADSITRAGHGLPQLHRQGEAMHGQRLFHPLAQTPRGTGIEVHLFAMQHVPPLVDLTSLDGRRFTGVLFHRSGQRLAAIQNVEPRRDEVKPAFHQVPKQLTHHRRVLCRSLTDAQDRFAPVFTDTQDAFVPRSYQAAYRNATISSRHNQLPKKERTCDEGRSMRSRQQPGHSRLANELWVTESWRCSEIRS